MGYDRLDNISHQLGDLGRFRVSSKMSKCLRQLLCEQFGARRQLLRADSRVRRVLPSSKGLAHRTGCWSRQTWMFVRSVCIPIASRALVETKSELSWAGFRRGQAGAPRGMLHGGQQRSGGAVARNCKVEGDGVSAATVRKPATFSILPFDENGNRCQQGSGDFFVSIQGRGVRVRARVTPGEDGSYAVRFLCTESGTYFINISLYGEGLPGSPFMCAVGTPTACAESCVVSGNSLKQAIARVQQVFEIQFKDALGHVAHAEELDVFVELVEEQKDANGASEECADEQQALASPEPESPERATRGRSPQTARSRSPGGVRRAGAAAAGSPPGSGASPKAVRLELPAEVTVEPKPKPTVPRLELEMKECIVTSKSPLIVRSGLNLKSERLGQLRPGRKVTLLKVLQQEEHDGETSFRACIALDDGEPTHRAEIEGILLGSWRDVYPERPLWWEELELGSPRTPRSYRRQVPLGWVTVSKAGKELVTPRTQLPAGQRQQHIQAWARRQAVDKSIAATAMAGKSGGSKDKKAAASLAASKQDKSIFQNELSSDPRGIGFAFGGVEPGRLHAHGQLIDTHKVLYSVGVCGVYRLHIGLRHQTTPVNGSPFTLNVTPGPAHALSTGLPKSVLPLRGVVGNGEAQGCTIELRASDKMGNPCNNGGARVKCLCVSADVVCHCQDLANGSYRLSWQSESSGVFEVSVTIDDIIIQGTPTNLRLISDSPDLSRTTISGEGLTKAQAGKPATIEMRLHDQHGNVALAPPSLKFGLTVVRADVKEEKEHWKTIPSNEFKGEWHGEEFEMNYFIKTAGDLDLYLWAFDSTDREQKRDLLGSSHRINCVASKAHSAGSFIEGFSRVEVVGGTQGKKSVNGPVKTSPGPPGTSSGGPSRVEAQAASGTPVAAGELLVLKPQIRDQYGNPTATNEGTLTVELITADGTSHDLKPMSQVRSGLTTYEARYEPELMGDYIAHVCLAGAPINGSPITFQCLPALPNVVNSFLTYPKEQIYSNTLYEVLLRAVDRYGNECDRGGAAITGRLASATLPHGQEAKVPIVDHGDGTYALQVNLIAPCEIKLIVEIGSEKERGATVGGGAAGELPPVPMNFLSLKAKEKEAKDKQSGLTAGEGSAAQPVGAKAPGKRGVKAKSPADTATATSPSSAKAGGASAKALQGAAKEMISAMGLSEDRRTKFVRADEAMGLAIEAFQEAGVPADAAAKPSLIVEVPSSPDGKPMKSSRGSTNDASPDVVKANSSAGSTARSRRNSADSTSARSDGKASTEGSPSPATKARRGPSSTGKSPRSPKAEWPLPIS